MRPRQASRGRIILQSQLRCDDNEATDEKSDQRKIDEDALADYIQVIEAEARRTNPPRAPLKGAPMAMHFQDKQSG